MNLEDTIKDIIKKNPRSKLELDDQVLKWNARNKDHAPEADAMRIAEAYQGQDVTREEIKELQPRVWIYREYIGEALARLGYNALRDDLVYPPRIIYTKKKLCPFCKKLLPEEFQK